MIMPDRPLSSPPPEAPASNRSAQDPQKPGQPLRPGPPIEPEDPALKAEGPTPPAPYTATREPGKTDDRPDETGRHQGDKGGL
jgi:hypothetical protein